MATALGQYMYLCRTERKPPFFWLDRPQANLNSEKILNYDLNEADAELGPKLSTS